eukprot:Skav201461  [mRNA]  locus=scaffold6:416118:416750:+ [translate_table: standard]
MKGALIASTGKRSTQTFRFWQGGDFVKIHEQGNQAWQACLPCIFHLVGAMRPCMEGILSQFRWESIMADVNGAGRAVRHRSPRRYPTCLSQLLPCSHHVNGEVCSSLPTLAVEGWEPLAVCLHGLQTDTTTTPAASHSNMWRSKQNFNNQLIAFKSPSKGEPAIGLCEAQSTEALSPSIPATANQRAPRPGLSKSQFSYVNAVQRWRGAW